MAERVGFELTVRRKGMNREGAACLVEPVRSRRIGAAVVLEVARLSSRAKDTLAIMDTIAKKNIAFNSIMKRIDTKMATGQFFLNIATSMAQEYARMQGRL
jgi:DNA invertase Pin-like site-specific DNA recombinase